MSSPKWLLTFWAFGVGGAKRARMGRLHRVAGTEEDGVIATYFAVPM